MARLLPGLVLMLVGCTESTVSADVGSGTEEADASVSDGVDAETVWDGGQRFGGTRPDVLDLLIVTEEDAMFSGPLRAGIPWLTRALGASGIDVRLGVVGSDLGDPEGAACELPTGQGGALLRCDDGVGGAFFDPRAMTREEINLEMRCRLPVGSSLQPDTNQQCQLPQSFDAVMSAMSPQAEAGGLNTPLAHGDGVNEPFFRREAFLAILILTVPDDCSLRDRELTTRDGYEGETIRQKCVLNPEALRPTSEVAQRLTRIRGADTFGVYSISNMPSELSGQAPEVILADSRMAFGAQIFEPIATSASSGWDPESRIIASLPNVTASRRIVELCSSLNDLGVHTGAFSYQFEPLSTGQEAFEEAVAPVASRVLEGLRQPR